jgi:hypothetical protein
MASFGLRFAPAEAKPMRPIRKAFRPLFRSEIGAERRYLLLQLSSLWIACLPDPRLPGLFVKSGNVINSS